MKINFGNFSFLKIIIKKLKTCKFFFNKKKKINIRNRKLKFIKINYKIILINIIIL